MPRRAANAVSSLLTARGARSQRSGCPGHRPSHPGSCLRTRRHNPAPFHRAGSQRNTECHRASMSPTGLHRQAIDIAPRRARRTCARGESEAWGSGTSTAASSRRRISSSPPDRASAEPCRECDPRKLVPSKGTMCQRHDSCASPRIHRLLSGLTASGPSQCDLRSYTRQLAT